MEEVGSGVAALRSCDGYAVAFKEYIDADHCRDMSFFFVERMRVLNEKCFLLMYTCPEHGR